MLEETGWWLRRHSTDAGLRSLGSVTHNSMYNVRMTAQSKEILVTECTEFPFRSVIL